MTSQATDNAISVISLKELQADYDGSLLAYCQREAADDVIIQFALEVDVPREGICLYEVMVGVTWHYQMAEPVAALADQLADPEAVQIFAWVPAHLYGQDGFSVYIAEHELGENLVHGLIGEVIRTANIEHAVANHTQTKNQT